MRRCHLHGGFGRSSIRSTLRTDASKLEGKPDLSHRPRSQPCELASGIRGMRDERVATYDPDGQKERIDEESADDAAIRRRYPRDESCDLKAESEEARDGGEHPEVGVPD